MTESVTALVRVVLKSGSMTELMYSKTEEALEVERSLRRGGTGPCRAIDDFGHAINTHHEDLAAVIYVNLVEELKGQSAMTFARQMMQDRLAERVNKTRELTSPPVMMPQQSPKTSMLIRS